MARSLGRLARDAWLVLGLALVLLAFVEGVATLALRLYAGPRATLDRTVDYRVAADLYGDAPWVPAYYRELFQSLGVRWEPYVYWRRAPFRGAHVTIGADGRRVTPRAPHAEGAPVVRILAFGGSTLWGTGARDAFTIPALLARELAERGVAAEVENFGESGYVTMQETIALALELRGGRVPDLVIFYDGANDVYSAHQQGVAGWPQNEGHRREELNLANPEQLGRRALLVLRDAVRRTSSYRLATALGHRLGVASGPAFPPATTAGAGADPAALARDVAATYWRGIALVAALGEHYGFGSLFYWQPTIFAKAHLTAYERAERDKEPALARLHALTDAALRATVPALPAGAAFHDVSRVFAAVETPLYTDWCHLGEAGNAAIARLMAEDATAMLAVRPTRD